MKAKSWTHRQLKKARWKRSLERAKKRGPVYGGYVTIDDESLLSSYIREEALPTKETFDTVDRWLRSRGC